MLCIVCKTPVSNVRLKAGYGACMDCADKLATEERRKREMMVGPSHNKGGLCFLGGTNFRQNLLDAGRKDSASINLHISKVWAQPKRTTTPVRKPVGVAWNKHGESFALFRGDDPRKRGAVRYCYFDSMVENV